MDAETLRARHEAAVARYARQVGDDGSVPDGLLRELAAIADEHRRTERGADAWLPGGEPVVAREVVLPMGEPFSKPDDAGKPVRAIPVAAKTTTRRTRTRTR